MIVAILRRGPTNALLAFGIVYIPQMARVVRPAVDSVCERDYAEAESVPWTSATPG